METADPAIRMLTTDDLGGAMGLSTAAGWNQRVADWRVLLQLAPAGSFAAVVDSGIIGTAIGIDYGEFGWIAMMLVDPAWRGRGIGARLLEEAMSAVPSGIPIRLDATPLGRPLYQRYGFEDEAMLTRHVAEPLDVARGRPSSRCADPEDVAARHVRRLTEADLPAVNALDDRVFCGRRHSLLKWALDGAPHYAHVIQTNAGAHYCFGRPGRLFDQIGPVVATADDTARALVSASLLAAEGRAVVVDAFDRNSGFVNWLGTCGFSASRPLFRMRRASHDGGRVAQAQASGPFAERAILGPEFG